MCLISIDRLTMAEAEALVAAVWRAVEEQEIPSPRLRVYRVDEAVDIGFEFLSDEDGDLVRGAVPRLGAAARLPPNLTPIWLRQPIRSYRKLVQTLPFARRP
jgi:hypothetical protein